MADSKMALVLSAGGMFGAYQAGAYRALFNRLIPDVVVGASVGALNGWLIASRCTPDQLTERWLDPAAGRALRMFDPEPLRRYCEELVARSCPVIPFGVTLTRRPWYRPKLVRSPDITAAHLQATCSIPLFLPPIEIDGIRCSDGGFLEKLPVWAAIEMGATRIIAIDALPATGPWWLRAGMRTVRLFRPRRPAVPDVRITIISPSEFMGTARDAVVWTRENAERWIALGERDASAITPTT